MPLFINAIPVSLGNDAYPICIFASMILHNYFPVLREIVGLAPMLKVRLQPPLGTHGLRQPSKNNVYRKHSVVCLTQNVLCAFASLNIISGRLDCHV